jgi:hypothetical protein
MAVGAGAVKYAAYFQDLKDSGDNLYFSKHRKHSWVSFTHHSIDALPCS